MKILVSACLLGENCKYNGVNQVYDGSFSGRLIPGSGVFAQTLREAGYLTVDAEDIAIEGLIQTILYKGGALP